MQPICKTEGSFLKKNKNQTTTQSSNSVLGDIFKENNAYPTAISYYEKAIENLNIIKEHHTIYRLHIKIAKLYQTSEFDSKWSIDALNKALKHANTINETSVYNDIYMAYGDFYCSKDECELAENYFNEILKNDINKNNISDIEIALTKKANILIKASCVWSLLSLALPSRCAIHTDCFLSRIAW